MDNEQAKLILQAYRPNGMDAGDPFFSEALEQTRKDPALGQWFASQQAFDKKVSAAVARIVPPSRLRDTIFLTQKVAPFPKTRTHTTLEYRGWLAAAAVIVFLLVAGAGFRFTLLQRPNHGPTLAAMTEHVLDLKRRDQINLGEMDSNPEKLRAWLAQRGAPSDFAIPRGLAGVPALGCQSYRVDGAKVALICFSYAPKQIVHLFIIDRDAVSDGPESANPEVHTEGDIAYAVWTQGGKSYVLTGNQISADILRQILQAT